MARADGDSDRKTCPRCDNSVTAGARHCGYCSYGFENQPTPATAHPSIRCSVCGTGNPVDARYCEKCGKPMKEYLEATRARTERGCLLAILVVVALVVVLAIASSITGNGDDVGDGGGDDILAEHACEEFGDLRDVELYTPEELREQVQQIWDDARYAENALIRQHARDLLAAVTSGDASAVGDAAAGMAAACSAL